MAGIVPFVAVDCDAESNRALCGQHGVQARERAPDGRSATRPPQRRMRGAHDACSRVVPARPPPCALAHPFSRTQGFPTIKLFRPTAGLTDYTGGRSAKDLAGGAAGLLTAKHITKLGSLAEGLAFLERPSGKARAGGCRRACARPLCLARAEQLAFGEVQLSKVPAELRQKYGIEAAPTLLFIAEDRSHAAYEGELKAPAIVAWIKGLAGGGKVGGKAGGRRRAAAGAGAGAAAGGASGRAEADASKAGAREQREEKEAKEPEPRVVRNATVAKLPEALEQEGVVLLAFFAAAPAAAPGAGRGASGAAGAPQGCEAALERLNSLVIKLQGLVQGLQAFLVPFDAEDHAELDEWRPLEPGALADARAVHKAALQASARWGERRARRLADGPGGSKEGALFPATYVSPVTAETYQHVWMSGPDRLKACWMHSVLVPSIHVAFQMPAGQAGKAGAPAADSAPRFHVQPYTGPLRFGDISTFLTILSVQLGVAPADLTNPQPADVPQLTQQSELEAACLSQGGLCVLAALGGGAARDEALAALRALAAERAEQPLRFAWLDAGAHPAFCAALGIEAPPALAVLSPRKRRAAVYAGRWDADALGAWLDAALAGRVRTAPLAEDLPPLGSGAGAGGAGMGEDDAGAAEEPMEDEFSLADILGVELEAPVGGSPPRDASEL
eukprot:scaffold24.g2935.t1